MCVKCVSWWGKSLHFCTTKPQRPCISLRTLQPALRSFLKHDSSLSSHSWVCSKTLGSRTICCQCIHSASLFLVSFLLLERLLCLSGSSLKAVTFRLVDILTIHPPFLISPSILSDCYKIPCSYYRFWLFVDVFLTQLKTSHNSLPITSF